MILFNDDQETKLNMDDGLDEAVSIEGMKSEVNTMLKELEEIEKSIGMESNSQDLDFPKPKPVILPKVNIEPKPTVSPDTRFTRADFAKLDDDQLDAIMKRLNKIDGMQAEIDAMKAIIDERLNVDFKAMYENLMEKNNIEAIKTYRNIQAVIIEENAKQNKALFGIDGKSDSLRRRLNHVIVFSIISFVVSILVMLMIILPAFGIDLL